MMCDKMIMFDELMCPVCRDGNIHNMMGMTNCPICGAELVLKRPYMTRREEIKP
jgi:hypothetical protein